MADELELEAYVPITVKLLEHAPNVEVASVAIVTAKRSDGGVELTIPQCHIHIDAKGKPVRAWTKSKNVHVTALAGIPYEIELPLMPAMEDKDATEAGSDAVHEKAPKAKK